MSESISITGLTGVVSSLEDAGALLNKGCKTAVQVTSLKVKRSAQAKISGHAHLPAYPSSITYDTTATAAGAQGVIGPDKNRSQGPLGNILEYGTGRHAPLPHLGPALEENADDLIRGVEIAVRQAVGDS